MSSYQGTAARPDRAKAIIAVVAVHAALAFVILTGLNVKLVTQAVQHLKTFNLDNIPPPPPVPAAAEAAAAEGERSGGRSGEKGTADPDSCSTTRHSSAFAAPRRKDRGDRRRHHRGCWSCG